MNTPCCTCPQCRDEIRAAILRTFDRERRWMGRDAIRVEGDLGWVPYDLYKHIVWEMTRAGDAPLVQSYGPGDEFPRYMASRLMPRPVCLSNSANSRRPLGPERGE